MSLLLRSISSGAAAFARVIPFLTKLIGFWPGSGFSRISSNIAERLSISSGDRKEGLQEQTSWKSLGGHAGEYETIFNRQQG